MRICKLFILATVFFSTLSIAQSAYYKFDSDGNLIRPTDYREWVFAGSAATPKSNDPKALFPDLQYVYIDPASYAYWKKNGEFPDGTILVKEIAYVGDTTSPVGKGFFTGEYRSLSATVKDSKMFPNTKGNWNYFNWTNKKTGLLAEKAKPLGKKCSTCHLENAPTGDVFFNFFSVLRDSKGVGAISPENKNTRKGLTKAK